MSLPNFGARPPQSPAAPTGGAALDRANIDSLLRGEFDPYEINMQSAERAVGGGTAGSGFALAGRYKLLDSEKLARKRLGNEMLDPYLNREHQQQLQSEAEAARMAELKADAEYAMERLRMSEAGLGERLSAQQRAELEQIAARGAQATELEKLNQKGNLEQTALGGLFNLLGKGGYGGGVGGGGSPRFNSEKYGGRSFRFQTDNNGLVTGGAPPPADYWTPSGGGRDRNVNTLINDILKKYNFGGLKF